MLNTEYDSEIDIQEERLKWIDRYIFSADEALKSLIEENQEKKEEIIKLDGIIYEKNMQIGYLERENKNLKRTIENMKLLEKIVDFPTQVVLTEETERIYCEKCGEMFLFHLRDEIHEFGLGLADVLRCLRFAEKMGAIPQLPPQWWTCVKFTFDKQFDVYELQDEFLKKANADYYKGGLKMKRKTELIEKVKTKGLDNYFDENVPAVQYCEFGDGCPVCHNPISIIGLYKIKNPNKTKGRC